MNNVKAFSNWFNGYYGTFLGRNEDLDFAAELKQQHTHEVCAVANLLSTALGLPEEGRNLAFICALFHDVGRFEQFAVYGTFDDGKSENHALLGLEVLEKEGVLNGLGEKERRIIQNAVRYHNCLNLPHNLSVDEIFFTRLVRDADKIDIYRITSRQYSGLTPTGNDTINFNLPDTPDISPAVMDSVEKGELVRYRDCTYVNDFKLLQLSWIYDMNFSESYRILERKGYLNVLMETLPGGERVDHIKSSIKLLIKERVQGPTAE